MWNRFKNNLKEFFRIFKLEFKTNFGGHRLKMLKFLGVLIVPFLYGFIYIFAMWNPITNTKASDMAIIASDKMAQEDEVYKAMMKKVDHLNDKSKTITLKKATIPANDLYSHDDVFKNEIGKHNISIVIQPIHEKNSNNTKTLNLTEYIGNVFAYALNEKQSLPGSSLFKLINALIHTVSPNTNTAIDKIGVSKLVADAIHNSTQKFTAPFKMYFNYKKNYVLGFGASNKILGSETIMKIIKSALSSQAPQDKKMTDAIKKATIEKYAALNGVVPGSAPTAQLVANVEKAITQINNIIDKKFDTFDPRIIMNEFEGKGEIEQYGFGLAPLFICVGLWIGALSTTLMVTPKMHERNTSKVKTFFAKLSLIWIANILQETILLGALIGIGFYSLGTKLPLFFLTGYLVAMLFSTMVFSIRCAIPTKITGIILVTFFFVFQVTASGGLFPTYTQKGFFRVLHPLMPFTYSINMFRQTLINPVATDWIVNLLILTTLAIPFAIAAPIIYAWRKNKVEQNNQDAFTEADDEKRKEIAEIESALSDRLKGYYSNFKDLMNKRSKKKDIQKDKKKPQNNKGVK